MRLHDYFDFHAREQPEASFAVFQDRALTWSEALRCAHQIANALVRCGVVRGDRVAILAKNCLEYPLFYYAAAKVGAVPVPLNYRLAAPEWSVILSDAAPTILFARGDLAAAVAPLRTELPGIHTWVALDADAPEDWLTFADWLRESPDSAPKHLASEDDDVYQMYTSGTTGRPKGAVLTHAAVCANVDQLNVIAQVGAGDRFLIVAPMYHAAAAINVFNTVRHGGTLVIMEDFDPAAVVHALSGQRITATVLVPAMIQACLVTVAEAAALSYQDLRYIGYGGSPIAAETLRHAIEVFGCDFGQGYGMTEVTAVATGLSPRDHQRALAGEPELLLSGGRPLPGTEVRVVDSAGHNVPIGEIGEILVRGPQLMRGYWNMPEVTEQTLAGGWMHTGDAGCIDSEGFVFVQDRVKDMIVSGGENIYPREVENALFEHPAIADAAVIGVPDQTWGEAVKAVVVLRDGHAPDELGLIEFCRTYIAGFKCPRSVDFVAELPRNPSGKVLKKDLREPHWEGHTRRVS
jgi:acyl-CoA synthetase (AMP-forming)/AMP-acid ligase II